MNRIALTVITALVLAAANSYSTTLFSLGDTVRYPDSGANTFYSTGGVGSPGTLVYTPTPTPTLTETTGGTNLYNYTITYFDAFTLTNVGDKITLSYSLSPQDAAVFATGAQRFRVGLFNSNNNEVTADFTATGVSALTLYTGYSAQYSIDASPAATNTFYQRTGTNTALWSAGTWTNLSSGLTLNSLGTGDFTGSLTLELVATGVQITSVINGGTAQSYIDTTGTVTTFDTVSFMTFYGTAGKTLTFDELTVTAVPEPSTYTMLAMAGVGTFWLLRRKSRRLSRQGA